MKPFLFPAVLAISLLLSGCDIEEFGNSDRFQTNFHYNYPLQPGGRINIENFNGSVEITGWDQNTVDISGVKYAATEAMRDAIKIDVTPSADSIYIRTIRPSDRLGNMGARYVLKVPRKVQLERIGNTNGAVRASDIQGAAHLRTTNGEIHVARFEGGLDATTTNGSIDVEDVNGGVNLHTSNGRVRADAIRGGPFEAVTSNGGISLHLPASPSGSPLKLTTSNGSIDLTLDSVPTSDIRASSTNGPITLHLPAATSARVRAVTTNSSITTDFTTSMQGEVTKHHLEGTIGQGGPLLDISTSNGNVRLLKM